MNATLQSWSARLLPALATCLLVLASGSAAATTTAELNLPQIGEPADNTLSPAQEKELGKQVVAQLYAANYTVDDPELSDYVNAIGYQLAGASATQPPPLTLFVVQDPRINAFALPGGYIGVNAGTLLASDNESELAGVLGHEMAHVTQRHIRSAEHTSELQSLMRISYAVFCLKK